MKSHSNSTLTNGGHPVLFNSFSFAVFLPIVFAVYWTIPHKYRWLLILVASYYFYMSWNVKYIVLIAFTTSVSFASAILIERTANLTKKKAFLSISIISSLGLLFVFKYLNFFFNSLNSICSTFSIPLHPITVKLILPVGISFYTFQTLSYVIDVYRGEKAERNFGIYAAFISFFPQLVAGPIERSSNLLPQIKSEHTFCYDQATYGLKLMAWGFFKKIVVADNLAVYVDLIYNNVRQYQGFALVLAACMFSIQIYCDFSGYSDIARGTAKLFGIELMENFRSPYFSTTIKEFWSRWHISLSTWFRDYLYIPLGGNRRSKLRSYFNQLVTFLVSGLWHGADWSFVVWGGIHGLGQIAENALGIKKNEQTGSAFWFVRTFAIFIFTTLAWIFFRADTISDALYVLTHLFTGIASPISYLHNGFSGSTGIGMGVSTLIAVVLVYLLPLFCFDYYSTKHDVIQKIGKKQKLVRWIIYFILIICILFFRYIGEVTFVYFQF